MALAAVLDPVTNDAAVVFYYKQEKDNINLAVNLYSLSGGADSLFVDNNTSGSLATPSSLLAAGNFLGSIRVFGVANIPKAIDTPTDKTNVVVQTSPVLNPISHPSDDTIQVPAGVPLAVCKTNIDGDTTGYVCYLKTIDGALQAVYWTIKRNDSAPSTIEQAIHKNSKLAACAVNEQPWIFYQNPKGEVRAYNIATQSEILVQNTDTILEGSHIAAIAADGIIYVYFVSNKNMLRRVKYTNGGWSGAKDVSTVEVTPGSAIGLVGHKRGDETIIWHFFRNEEHIVHEQKGPSE
ncbi:hypothetical protein AbraIFM66951_009148 [Aspergillus brasiliensis]|uniref:Fucose-specific lectin n=1 Tax=Aspergillus brasiliensis TaxID=319629 RepID=A0A9W6DQM0_9EURO|nr:hypothetical protein AbraCBS73388_010520 [Aspergillus brasiliensis]GKZ46237.1 hypothetical protein AbraIFM66951_009148 [Aspergillus brasiliensis]